MYSLQYSNQPIFVANGMAGSIVHCKGYGTKYVPIHLLNSLIYLYENCAFHKHFDFWFVNKKDYLYSKQYVTFLAQIFKKILFLMTFWIIVSH